MKQIENELKKALRRKPAPRGLAAKVLERIEGGRFEQNTSRHFTLSRFRSLAIAAVIAITFGVGLFEHLQRIRNRNEDALQRTRIALAIAAVELERAERKAFELMPWEKLSQQLAKYQSLDTE
jgi:hypothetical protein